MRIREKERKTSVEDACVVGVNKETGETRGGTIIYIDSKKPSFYPVNVTKKKTVH